MFQCAFEESHAGRIRNGIQIVSECHLDDARCSTIWNDFDVLSSQSLMRTQLYVWRVDFLILWVGKGDEPMWEGLEIADYRTTQYLAHGKRARRCCVRAWEQGWAPEARDRDTASGIACPRTDVRLTGLQMRSKCNGGLLLSFVFFFFSLFLLLFIQNLARSWLDVAKRWQIGRSILSDFSVARWYRKSFFTGQASPCAQGGTGVVDPVLEDKSGCRLRFHADSKPGARWIW